MKITRRWIALGGQSAACLLLGFAVGRWGGVFATRNVALLRSSAAAHPAPLPTHREPETNAALPSTSQASGEGASHRGPVPDLPVEHLPPAATPPRQPIAHSQALAANKPSGAATTSSGAGRSLLTSFRILGVGPGGGLRLGRVAPGTLPALIGLESFDELISINGYKLADPEQALTAYARLRTVGRLQLALERGGKQTELLYWVR